MNILTNMQNQNPSGSGSLPSNTVANSRGDVKAITYPSGVLHDGQSIPHSSHLPKEVERETAATKDKLDECYALADLVLAFTHALFCVEAAFRSPGTHLPTP
ncbi:hypothetical protein Tco_0705180 [Tanacetum coccineum]|uniref:Uncharacterized protein n=1 Tax=Tanacetum coccineum TaxID=301880 RepID=A0ABQ4Y3V2_9ASTR